MPRPVTHARRPLSVAVIETAVLPLPDQRLTGAQRAVHSMGAHLGATSAARTFVYKKRSCALVALAVLSAEHAVGMASLNQVVIAR